MITSDVGRLINQGAKYFQEQKFDLAERTFKKALRLEPKSNLVHFNLGLTYQALKKPDEAAIHFKQAAKANSRDFEALNNLGHLFLDKKETKPAIKVLSQAVKINPYFAEGYYNLGVAYQLEKQVEKAIENYQTSISLKYDHPNVFNNLAVALNKTGRTNEAIENFKKALSKDPANAMSLSNLGALLIGQNAQEAEEYLKRAIEADPDRAEAFHNLGVARQNQGRVIEVIGLFKKAIELEPNFSPAYGPLYHNLRMVCDWAEVAKIGAVMDEMPGAETPFVSVTRTDDPALNLKIAQIWSEAVKEKVKAYHKPNFNFKNRPAKRKIRLGYLSNDFHDHATSHLTQELFGIHNRDRFEVYVYSYGGKDKSEYRRKIEKGADKFLDITCCSYLQAAEIIHQDEIDILIDLKGHTRNSRLEILALRPAPAQVHYLGFPGTIGADFIDYFIADEVVLPKNQMKFFTEKIIYLPGSYQINCKQKISAKKFTRADFNLPKDAFVYCCFNQPYKINPEVFNLWMKVLKEIPGSVLWLLWKNRIAELNLREAASAYGIEDNRLLSSPSLPKDEHLKRLQLADIAFDTFPCNGHTSTSDALWAGVPVITLLGKHFASRVSAGLLTAIGLPELIVHNKSQYVKLATTLAKNPKKLDALRAKLSANRLSKPLFDTKKFVKNLEQAYGKIWEDYSKTKIEADKLPTVVEININQDASPPTKWPHNSIVFFCGPQVTPWNPQGLKQPGKTFLGGSEEAMAYLSQELKKLGWDITVYAQPEKEKKYQGIKWLNYSKIKPQDFFNILIFWRRIELIDLDCRAKKTYLWCQDILEGKNFTPERLKKLNKIIVLSQAHRNTLPKTPDDKFLISANGFLEHFPNIKPKNNSHWCMWTSSYNRGLEHMLKIWPEVIKAVPDAQLHIFYGWQLLDQFNTGDPAHMAWKAKIEQLFTQPGVIHHGRVPQTEIEEWYKKCGLFTYPSNFFETSCISAIKAQAFGAVPITATTGALNETVQYGTKISGDINNLKVLEKYKTALIKALKDHKWQDEQRKVMIPWAKKKYSWAGIARQWSKEFKKND